MFQPHNEQRKQYLSTCRMLLGRQSAGNYFDLSIYLKLTLQLKEIVKPECKKHIDIWTKAT